MTADQIFTIANTAALLGWLLLIFAGRLRWVATLVTGVIIPGLFAILYIGLLIAHWGEGKGGGFNTLGQVMILFSNPWLVLGGWVHYLAFDLFIGSWEARDAARNGIPHLAVIPCLMLTFLFGPAGLLLYFVLRAAMRKVPALTAS